MNDDTGAAALRDFRYEAQAADGHPLSGTLRAKDADDARAVLERAELRVLELEERHDVTPRPLRGDDFYAFNQQLAQLTDAGLPVESGLRLIAEDMRRGRLAASVRAVADALDAGATLPEAFEANRQLFPPLYGRLVDAGIRSNRLSGVLLNLSRHMEMTRRLQAALWRAGAYPLVVLVVLVAVLGFIGVVIMPQFGEMYDDFAMELPTLTSAALSLSTFALPLLIGFGVLLVGVPLTVWVLTRMGLGGALRDHLLLPLPLVGRAVNRNLMTRWCDLLRLGVSAGLDLPTALALARDAVGSGPVRRDTARLIDTLEAGKPLNWAGHLEIIPATVPASMELASQRADLSAMLGDLAAMFEQQAEMRLNTLQVSLAPFMLIIVGGVVSTAVIVLFLPLVKLMSSLM